MKEKFLLIFCLVALISCVNTEPEKNELPKVTTLPVQNATSSTAVLCGSTQGGAANMICRGVCFSSNEIFTFKDSPCVSVDSGEGEFSSKTYELIPKHLYYMKAFAVLKDGTVIYGETMTFSTTDFMLPTVDATDASDVYATEATLNGRLIEEGDYGVASKGFVYTSNPTATLELGADEVFSIVGIDGPDGFSAAIGDLGIGVTYRYCAYAMTENGAGYSAEKTFSTLNIHPVEFAAIETVENTYSSLKIKSAITDPCGSTISSFGFCWSEDNKLPTKRNSEFKDLESDFTMSFDRVKPGRIFYVRPYAESVETGINYGSVTKVRVKTYDCDGGMIKVVPNNPVYIGWLGDYENTSFPAKYTQAHDGEYQVNQSVGRSSTPCPAEATLQPFCIAKYEVTNRWFCEFLNAYGSSIVKDGTWKGESILYPAYTDITNDGTKWVVEDRYLDCPVVGVTFYGATAFCEFFGGFLPSEAQWEVAARGNVYSNDPAVPMYRYSGSDDLNEIAIWASGSVDRSHVDRVGQMKPNQLGIYDMSGNAEEMTSSWWGEYTIIYKENPMPSGKQISIRGGRAQRGVKNTFQNCTRSTMTINAALAYQNYIGFRFACDPYDD